MLSPRALALIAMPSPITRHGVSPGKAPVVPKQFSAP
jgi:hypothetical protein